MKQILKYIFTLCLLFVGVGSVMAESTTIVVKDQVNNSGSTATIKSSSKQVAYSNSNSSIWYLGTFNLGQISSIDIKGLVLCDRGTDGKAQLKIAAMPVGSIADITSGKIGSIGGTIRDNNHNIVIITATTTPSEMPDGGNATNYVGANFKVTSTSIGQTGEYNGNVELDTDNSLALSKTSGIYQLFVYATANKGRMAVDEIVMNYKNGGNQILGATADTWIRKGNTSTHTTEATMELHSEFTTTDGVTTYTADFLGLMKFALPEEAIGHITSAKLRLVTERCKGSTTANIWPYSNDFVESTKYSNEETYVNDARKNTPITFNIQYGVRSNSLASDDISKGPELSKWTNNIDITSIVEKATTSNVAIMIGCATSNSNAAKFFTKDAIDVTNAKNSEYTYSAADLVPQLTIEYTSGNAVKSYTLNVGEAKVSTAILPFDAVIPSGMKAYTLSYEGGNTTTATEVTNILAANTPVLINANKGEYEFTAINNSACPDIAADSEFGCLKGVYSDYTTIDGDYVLQNGVEGVGFYQVNTATATPKVRTYHAYIPSGIISPSSSKIAINIGEITGINTVEENIMNNEAIYNLQGMKVDKAYKGVVILKGKKFINK